MRLYVSRARPTRRRPQAAFTLVELLVTIGIMLFVLGVSVVAFNALFKSVGVRAAARTLAAAVDGARVRAIQQRRHIRFEAQLVPGSTTNQWRVTASAGDQAQEWRDLPDFVALACNAWKGQDRGPDGRQAPYRGGDQQPDTIIVAHRVSITFGPDGSVERYELSGVRQPDGSFADIPGSGGYHQEKEPAQPFAIRMTNMRDTHGAEPLQRWLVVIPLTGGVQPYEAEGETQ